MPQDSQGPITEAVPKHLPLPVAAWHFDRWPALFETTARDLYPPEVAMQFIAPAKCSASSPQMCMAGGCGIVLGPAERLD